MAQVSIKAGTTSYTCRVFIADSTSSTGAGKTGLLYNSASLTCYYKKSDGTASAALSLANITTLGTFVSGGFKEIDATNMPGWYEFHPSNTSISSGVGTLFTFQGATGMVTTPLFIELTAVDNQDATRGGMSALPNAVAGASNGLHINGNNLGTSTFSAITITGTLTISDGVAISRSTSNSPGLTITGNGSGNGATIAGGTDGTGLNITGGATSGNAMLIQSAGGYGMYISGGGNNAAIIAYGAGSGDAVSLYGGTSGGSGLRAAGGATTGNGITVTATTSGHGIEVTANGTSKHGVTITGGTGGTSDGMKLVAGTGGVDLRGAVNSFTAAALAQYFTLGTTKVYADAIAGSVVKEIASNAGGGGGLDAAGVRAAIGMASADMDTQLGTLATASNLATVAGYIDTEIGTLQTSVDDLPTNGELTTALSGLATASALSTVEGKIDTVDTNVDTLLTRITANLFSGITYLSKWLGAIAGKTADTGTRTEINATTAGATYNETTDSLEAQKDAGGGGTDWTADEKTAIKSILGVPASGTTPDTPAAGMLFTINTNVTTANTYLTTNVGALGVNLSAIPKTGYKLAADGANLVLVDGVALPTALARQAAILCGEVTQAGTVEEIFTGWGGTVVTITVDVDGNRSAVVFT